MVYEQVSRDKPELFNALNLATLQTGRPAPLEAPAICARFQTGEEWLNAWLAWYASLDEATLPRADAERTAAKKGLSVQDAFAGLLIFDLFCMATVKHAFPAAPFSDIAAFTESLPFATYSGKHDAAASFFDKEAADLVFVQEARNLNDNPETLRSFLEPLSGSDAFTSVLARKDKFADAKNISAEVCAALTKAIALRFPEAPAELAAGWATTIRRMAVARLTYGHTTVCAASLHCNRSGNVADLLEVLKDVLSEIVGEALFIVGLDSNVPGKSAAEFQGKLREMGMDFGEIPKAEQVTVAKMRTVFQTQVKKAGDTDVSHKDFILTWGLAKRKSTAYTPDLWSKFGIDRNGQTVRLPTTYWPFDHAAVVVRVMVYRGPGLLENACRRVVRWLVDWHQEMLGLVGLALAVSFLSVVTVLRPYVCDKESELSFVEVPLYFCVTLQLA